MKHAHNEDCGKLHYIYHQRDPAEWSLSTKSLALKPTEDSTHFLSGEVVGIEPFRMWEFLITSDRHQASLYLLMKRRLVSNNFV